MFKLVNGISVQCSPSEQSSIESEWAYNASKPTIVLPTSQMQEIALYHFIKTVLAQPMFTQVAVDPKITTWLTAVQNKLALPVPAPIPSLKVN